MIGRKNLHVTAERANFPLGALNVRAGSAANVALFDVPERAGVSVTAVWMRVTNCDGETADYAAVQTGTLWVVDVPAAHFATPGEVPNGVEVWASGTGADGEPHTWSIGVGDLCVLDGDSGTPVPGTPWTAIKLRETTPENPAYGDAMISSGALYVWDGTQWVGGGGGGGIVEDAVTRASSNAVKSSGIWSAIWGTLAALPSGFTALYDWVVDQLARKLSTSGGTMTGPLKLKGAWLDFEDAETPADMGGIYVAGDTSTGGTVLRLVQWQNGGMVAAVALSAGSVALKADIPAASTDTPLADGVASPGASAAYARGDHRHPTDTSRAAASALVALAQTVAGKAATADLRYSKVQCVVAANPLPDAFFPITFTYNGVPYTASSNADLTYYGDTSSYYVHYNLPGGGDVALAYVADGVWEIAAMDDLAVNGCLVGAGLVVPLLDRAVQSLDAGAYTNSGDTTVYVVPPPAVAGRVRDCLIDVDNSSGAYSADLEFAGLGTTFVLIPPDGDDLAEMTSVDGGARARFYFTETALVSNGLPVISIQRITLGAVATAITRGS